jgi:hypothetical protein
MSFERDDKLLLKLTINSLTTLATFSVCEAARAAASRSACVGTSPVSSTTRL